MESNEINAEMVTEAISQNKWVIIICLILMLVFFVLFIISMKKHSRKSRERLHNELQDYFNYEHQEPYNYGGRVSVSYNNVTYTRGNRSAVFEIPIEKETILAPCLVDAWFENRNYNGREANNILNDIKNYLLENKICKKVLIVDDNEYLENNDYEEED